MTRALSTAQTQQNVGGATPPFVAGKNKIINGDFGIWQRGTSFSGTGGTYTADRMYFDSGGSSVSPTITRQPFTPAAAPVAGYESPFFYRSSFASAGTSQSYNTIIIQKMEDVRTLAGQVVTASAWIKTDTPRSFSFGFIQDFGVGGSAAVNPAGGLSYQTTTTGWVRYSTTVTLPSISGKTVGTSSSLWLFVTTTSVNTAQTWDIWGLQVEAGSTATAFQTATGTLQGELAACQRYYFATQTGTSTYIGYAYATNGTIYDVPFPVSMRTNPTALVTSGTCSAYALNASTAITPTFDKAGVNSAQILGAITITAGQGSRIECGANSIGFSAEL